MLIFKILACVVIGFIGFYAFLQIGALDEFIKKANECEKKAIERLELIAIGLPLLIVGLIVAI